MAASKSTVEDVVLILVDEIGVEKAEALLIRLAAETTGNASYQATLKAIYQCLQNQVFVGGK